MTSPRRLRPLRASLAATAALAGLVAAEAVARLTYGPGMLSVADPYEHHPYRPNVDYVDAAGHRVTTNSLGWKDRESRKRVEKDHAELHRVVLLGDSFTEGLELPPEATVAAFAEEELNRGSGRYEVLNGGRVSYCPLLEYQRLKRFLAHGYRADTVVLLPDMSDVQDELEYAKEYDFAADGEPLRLHGIDYLPPVLWLYNHSALARWGRRLQMRLQGKAPPAEAAHAGREVVLERSEVALLWAPGSLSTVEYFRLPPRPRAVLRHTWVDHQPSLEGWAGDGLGRMVRNIARTHRLAQRHGMRLVVAIYPWPQVLYTEDDPAEYELLRRKFPRWFHEREQVQGTRPSAGATVYREAVAKLCRERLISFVDLFPTFYRTPAWHELFLAGDVHFSREGSHLVGREIAAAILRAETDGRRAAVTAAAGCDGPGRDRSPCGPGTGSGKLH